MKERTPAGDTARSKFEFTPIAVAGSGRRHGDSFPSCTLTSHAGVFVSQSLSHVCSVRGSRVLITYHPLVQTKVFFTDADKAAIATIEHVYPYSLHNLCIFHTIKNIRRHCGGLALSVLSAMIEKL